MVKILDNIFVFGGNEIPVYLTQDDWDRFVKTEIQKEGQYPSPWRSQFSPWQWNWSWCDVDEFYGNYVFMSDIQLKYDYELSESRLLSNGSWSSRNSNTGSKSQSRP